MTTRINKDLALAIAEPIVARKYDADMSALAKLKQRKARCFYDWFFDVALLSKLPKGFVPEDRNVNIRDEQGHVFSLVFDDAVRVPYDVSYGRVQLTKTNQDIVDYKVASEKLRELERARNTDLDELRDRIACFRTIPKLLREGPEIESFVPSEAKTPSGALAIRVGDLNAKFSLPAE